MLELTEQMSGAAEARRAAAVERAELDGALEAAVEARSRLEVELAGMDKVGAGVGGRALGGLGRVPPVHSCQWGSRQPVDKRIAGQGRVRNGGHDGAVDEPA